MTGLAEWLIARIAEDETAASVAPPEGAQVWGDAGWVTVPWSAARVLAECKAKREIVERYRVARTAAESIRDTFAGDNSPRARTERASYGAREGAWWDAMAAVALPYADRDGYDEEWRP